MLLSHSRFLESKICPSLLDNISLREFGLVTSETSTNFLQHAKIAQPLDVQPLQTLYAVILTYLARILNC